jgi:hypothetical protein
VLGIRMETCKQNKQRNKVFYTVRTVPKSNHKITERGKIDIPNT